MIKIKIKFFGILKDYFNDIEIEIAKNSTQYNLKNYIIANYLDENKKHLKSTILKSMFSNNIKLLNDESSINISCTLFLLPPFSGG